MDGSRIRALAEPLTDRRDVDLLMYSAVSLEDEEARVLHELIR